MRYFLTGGTGFIGGVLVRMLRESGHDVVALVRTPGKAASLREIGVEIVEGDITQPETLKEPMSGADGVYHCAAWYAVGKDSTHAEAINVGGTRNVLEAMKALDIPKGVYTSTLAVYSDTGGKPVNETYTPSDRPLSEYDRTKRKAHFEVALPMMQEDLPLNVVCPGIVYGPGDTSQLGAALARAARGIPVAVPGPPTGGCWSHVEDIARAHMTAMDHASTGQVFNINGPAHTYADAFQLAARVAGQPPRRILMPPAVLGALSPVMGVLGRALPIPPDFASETLRVLAGTTYFGDNAKARSQLGYDPRSLDTGFRQTFGTN